MPIVSYDALVEQYLINIFSRQLLFIPGSRIELSGPQKARWW